MIYYDSIVREWLDFAHNVANNWQVEEHRNETCPS